MCSECYDYMCFTLFVYAGWEGTTNDSRIMADTIYNPKWDFPHASPCELSIKNCLHSYLFLIYILQLNLTKKKREDFTEKITLDANCNKKAILVSLARATSVFFSFSLHHRGAHTKGASILTLLLETKN